MRASRFLKNVSVKALLAGTATVTPTCPGYQIVNSSLRKEATGSPKRPDRTAGRCWSIAAGSLILEQSGDSGIATQAVPARTPLLGSPLASSKCMPPICVGHQKCISSLRLLRRVSSRRQPFSSNPYPDYPEPAASVGYAVGEMLDAPVDWAHHFTFFSAQTPQSKSTVSLANVAE